MSIHNRQYRLYPYLLEFPDTKMLIFGLTACRIVEMYFAAPCICSLSLAMKQELIQLHMLELQQYYPVNSRSLE